jgi:hypothetical protein
MCMTQLYTKRIRTMWLDSKAQTYLPVAQELDSVELIPATTEGGKRVAEYLQWIRQSANYTASAQEYTQVYITEAQLTYILMRWNGILYATDKWREVD